MEVIKPYLKYFLEHLVAHPLTKEPKNLYSPGDYILALGGKRIRPLMVLMTCEGYGRDKSAALNASMCVEVFHNFTLLHDDIMDQASLRRGQDTVHIKYGLNTGILTGDVMLIQSYQYLLNYNDPQLIKSLLDVFNKMAFEVCEGQQMDMDFETSNTVSIADYIKMISLKTSVLLAASAQMGAIIAGADAIQQGHIYAFALNLGIAFQLHDDVLDTYGASAQVGKKIGGDILQNKKTYLYIKSLELADESQLEKLKYYYQSEFIGDEDKKIIVVTDIFRSLNVIEYSRQVIEAYKDLAISHLDASGLDTGTKSKLLKFSEELMKREY